MNNKDDKRSVFTDALETLGTIIDNTQKRDAIHLAVIPMQAKEPLEPGMHVDSEGHRKIVGLGVGIVDPFLNRIYVAKGQWFWCVLYPRTIKSLRHVWEHPAFPPSELNVQESSDDKCDDVDLSKKWMTDYALKIEKLTYGNDYGSHEFTYDDLMNAAKMYLEDNKYLCLDEALDGQKVDPDFWHHYEIITGVKINDNEYPNFFTCNC